MVVVEAASMGIPVILSGSCAATDFIKDGETGVYFEHGSATSLAGQIARLRDQPDEARRLGQAAYQWYWDSPWTAARHVGELLGVYRKILGEGAEPVKAAAVLAPPLEEVA
jgi:glycosyltransferase involved in cell wall biosynthesis